MKRRLDKSSDSRGDGVGGAKNRSRLLDVVAFVLPFVFVVLIALASERPDEKNDAPYDVALNALENSTEDSKDEAPTVSEISSNEENVDEKNVDERNAEFDAEIGSDEERSDEIPNEVPNEVLETQTLVDVEEQEEDKLSVEEAERLLAQLEFQLANVKKSDETDVDSLLATLSTVRNAAGEALENAPKETEERARQTFDEIQTFYQNLNANRAFYCKLNELDEASLDSDATRAFFDSITQEFSASSDELDEYRRDFARVANSLDALRGVERWNEFVDERGKALERFYVSKQDADAALNFLRDCAASVGTPREIAAITRRERELEYAAQNEVATRRKVLLRIEAELAKKYWTYRRDENSFYYLPESPRVGVNQYIANAQGELKSVEIPQNAPEIALDESPQKLFLRELFARADKIQDETRAEDVARWYREWCDVLTELQRADCLDPILQYALFRDVADILASSDYFFSRRLSPLTRMLDVPQLDDLSKIDVFRTEESATRNLRVTARARLSFLPKDHLKVDKTTEQLDANVAQFAWNYRRIGWLDRNFAGEWRCRRTDDFTERVGELWIFLADDAQGESTSASSRSRWIKIGVVDGRQTAVNLITSEAPRGSIVFCRTRADRKTTVAKRSSVERVFRR